MLNIAAWENKKFMRNIADWNTIKYMKIAIYKIIFSTITMNESSYWCQTKKQKEANFPFNLTLKLVIFSHLIGVFPLIDKTT